jgi:hypothetical protein
MLDDQPSAMERLEEEERLLSKRSAEFRRKYRRCSLLMRPLNGIRYPMMDDRTPLARPSPDDQSAYRSEVERCHDREGCHT